MSVVPTTHFFPELDPLMLQNDPLRRPPFHFSGSCFSLWCGSGSVSSFPLWCGSGSSFPKRCGSNEDPDPEPLTLTKLSFFYLMSFTPPYSSGSHFNVASYLKEINLNRCRDKPAGHGDRISQKPFVSPLSLDFG